MKIEELKIGEKYWFVDKYNFPSFKRLLGFKVDHTGIEYKYESFMGAKGTTIIFRTEKEVKAYLFNKIVLRSEMEKVERDGVRHG